MNNTALLKKFAKQPERLARAESANCVIYTRVSTKEQADNNMSLATQMKACEAYAYKNELTVLASFGGTYESAKTDERKEFTRMLTYVKNSRHKVAYILVYSFDRFSRSGPNAIYISESLRKQGIQIRAVTQPVDTMTPTGALQQNILFIFSEHDNQLRRQKCIAGMREMLLRGDWATRPPIGYDMRREHGKQVITINKAGKLIRKAFEWKANEQIENVEIIRRLQAEGLKISKQALTRIFTNIFYCGMMSHSSLEGEIVLGNHPPIVSQELF